MRQILPVVALLAAALCNSGCIAWKIRNEVQTTNQHLGEMKPLLATTLESLETVNYRVAQTQLQLAEMQVVLSQTDEHLRQTDAHLVQTDQHLQQTDAHLRETDQHLVAVHGTLGETNPKLNNLEGELTRMQILNEIHTSLQDVQKALGPLSTAMNSLGGAMSFLGMGDETSPDMLTDAGKAAPTPGALPGEPAAPGTEADQKSAKRPDAIVGTWVLVYPPPAPAVSGSPATSRITVLMADGRFLSAEDGKPPRTGSWSRKDRTLTLNIDSATPGGQPETEVSELLTLNSRTLTLKRGDIIRVHARP